MMVLKNLKILQVCEHRTPLGDGAVIGHTVMDRATGPTRKTHLGKLYQETKKEHGMDHGVDQLTIKQGSFERPVVWTSSYSWSYASWPLPTQSH